jgi:hypothetical protein
MAASIPSHIIGAMAGSASRFAGSAAIDTAPKRCANRGAVASGGDRHARALGEGAAGGRWWIRSVAPASQAQVPDPGREHQDARDRGEAELPAWVAGGSRIEREGERGREEKRVPPPPGPPGESRDHSRGAHDARALDRGAGTRDRHVDGDQCQQGDQSRAQ